MTQFHHILIAVMGMTGSGKSSFIKTVTGQDIQVGHGLRSCTQRVQDYFVQIGPYIVHLIDSPGFDDTTNSDTETLREIATFLAQSYQAGVKLTGILYLHKISENRFGNCAMTNLRMFRELCGENCLRNVILLTTMWSGSANDISLQEERERQLITDDDFWAGLLRLGARTMRYDNTAPRALEIVQDLMQRSQIVLEIQRELVVEGRNLNETSAGIQLRLEIAAAEERHKKELEQMRQEMQGALRNRDIQYAEEIKKREDQLNEKLAKIEQDKVKLASDLQQELRRHKETIQEMNSKNKRAGLMAIGGVALSLLTGGLGALAGLAFAGTSAAAIAIGGTLGLSTVPAAQIAGELGRRAIMGATIEANQLRSY